MHTCCHYIPDKVLDHLSRSTIFLALDLLNKTAVCPGPVLGMYEINRMPFGLTSAPSSFQHLVDKVLRGLLFATSYLDDILIHSETKDEHK